MIFLRVNKRSSHDRCCLAQDKDRDKKKRFYFKYQVRCSTFFLHKPRHKNINFLHSTLHTRKKCFQFLNVKFFSCHFFHFRKKEFKIGIWRNQHVSELNKEKYYALLLDIYEFWGSISQHFAPFNYTRFFNYVSSLFCVCRDSRCNYSTEWRFEFFYEFFSFLFEPSCELSLNYYLFWTIYGQTVSFQNWNWFKLLHPKIYRQFYVIWVIKTNCREWKFPIKIADPITHELSRGLIEIVKFFFALSKNS